MPDQKYLRTQEAAEILHVGSKSISRLARQGRLPFITTPGGHRRYPEGPIRELAARLAETLTTLDGQATDVV